MAVALCGYFEIDEYHGSFIQSIFV